MKTGMTARSFVLLFFPLLLAVSASLAEPADNGNVNTGGIAGVVFGPQGFQRTTGPPNVFQQTFAAEIGTGLLEVFNGGSEKGSQVTSAWVVLNGNQIFGPDDFRKKDPLLQASVTLGAQNALKITLGSSPGTYVVARVTQDSPFEEFSSDVLRADLAVTNLVLTPDRCSPGTPISLRATLMNLGPQSSDPATLVFGIDDNAIGQIGVGALPAQGSATLAFNWTAAGPGRHQAWAKVQPGPGTMDLSAGNNSRFAFVRVSGESSPAPELEFGPPQFDAGPPAVVTLKVSNPGFADLSNITLRLSLVNGPPQPLPELLPQRKLFAASPTSRGQAGIAAADLLCIGWDCYPDFIPLLPAGTSTTVEFPWLYDTAGQYVVQVRAENLPEAFPVEEATSSWDLVFPIGPAVVFVPAWSSIGPYQLDEPPTGPNTGKISALAIDPQNPNVIYAGSANPGDLVSGPGLWKTEDGGQHWTALGDKFSQMDITAIAVDPTNSNIVYCASGPWKFDTPPPVAPGLPGPITGYIFKSVDGGKNWVLFGHPADGYNRLVLRRQASSPQLVIYAASNRGVLRYTSDDALALSSQQSEWPVILPGKIKDVVVDPANPDLVFAVRYAGSCSVATGVCNVQLDGLYWTSTGLSAAGFQDWPNDYRFITPAIDQFMAVDLSPSNPQKVYLLAGDSVNSYLLIREEQGAAFNLAYSYPTPKTWEICRPDFLRPHPTVPDRLYAGCFSGKLFRLEKPGNAWYHTAVPGYHDDQHAMEFFPDSGSAGGWSFLEGNDGGINRTSYFKFFGFDWELPSTINNGLVSTEFYRAGFDVSPTAPDVMIGGMQDNGVIVSQPSSSPPGVWKANVNDFGDGTAAVIAPTDPKTMYAKPNNGMNGALLRSQDGGGSWQKPKHQNLIDPDKGSWIFTDPGSAGTIYYGGSEVQRSTNGGDSWEQLGPDDSQRRGDIVWVLASPTPVSGPNLYAGTDNHGQLWELDVMSYGLVWVLRDEHPDPGAFVISMAFATGNPNVLFVAYGGCTKDKRLARFEFWGTGGSHEWITGNLPAIHATTNTALEINALAASPHGESPVFVGTDKGVYQGFHSESGWSWTPYNNGLPLVRITKLIPIPLTGEIRASTFGRGVWSIKPFWFPGPG